MRAAVVVFVVSLLIGAIPFALHLFPPPTVHDELAYLLQADTFARGRLANPSHEHWVFFETFHVLQQPTYTAKFPPGQGLALAAGRMLGDVAFGAFGMVALAAGAVAWMLRAWLTERWSILGGIAASTHPLVFDWGQSYWGGGVAMFGSALLLGAWLRILRRPTAALGGILGVGIAILANSRPFEGLLLITVLAGWTILIRRQRRRVPQLRGCIVAAVAVLGTAGAWMAFYNYRVTGRPLRLPYEEHARQYMAAPLFWWQSPRTPEQGYRHEALRRFHAETEFREYEHRRGMIGVGRKLGEIVRARNWPPLNWIVVIGLCWSWKSRHVRFAVIGCGCWLGLHFLMTPWFRLHYLAVLAPVMIALTMIGVRSWRAVHRRGPIIAALVLLAGQAVAVGGAVRTLIYSDNVAALPRQQLIAELSNLPGPHLVFVGYEGEPQTIFEWVYNSADIDAQRIVFARDMSEENHRLIRYYPDRTVWRVTVTGIAYRIERLDP